jgi:hypothetical protein
MVAVMLLDKTVSFQRRDDPHAGRAACQRRVNLVRDEAETLVRVAIVEVEQVTNEPHGRCRARHRATPMSRAEVTDRALIARCWARNRGRQVHGPGVGCADIRSFAAAQRGDCTNAVVQDQLADDIDDGRVRPGQFLAW